jgi:hypothetical protein
MCVDYSSVFYIIVLMRNPNGMNGFSLGTGGLFFLLKGRHLFAAKPTWSGTTK